MEKFKIITLRVFVFLVLYFLIYFICWGSPLKSNIKTITPILILLVFFISKPITNYMMKIFTK